MKESTTKQKTLQASSRVGSLINRAIGFYDNSERYENSYFIQNLYGQWSQVTTDMRVIDKHNNVLCKTFNSATIKVDRDEIIIIPNYVLDSVSRDKKDTVTYQMGDVIMKAYEGHKIIMTMTKDTFIGNLGVEKYTTICAYTITVKGMKLYIPSFLNLKLEQVIILNYYLFENFTEKLAKDIIRELNDIYDYAAKESIITEMYQYADCSGNFLHRILWKDGDRIINKLFTVERKDNKLCYLVNTVNGKLLISVKGYNLFDLLYSSDTIKVVRNYVGNIEDIMLNVEEYVQDMIIGELETVLFEHVNNKYGEYSYNEGELYNENNSWDITDLELMEKYMFWTLCLSGNSSRILSRIATSFLEEDCEECEESNEVMTFEVLKTLKSYNGIDIEMIPYVEKRQKYEYILLEKGNSDIAVYENNTCQVTIDGKLFHNGAFNGELLDVYTNMMKTKNA